MDERRLTIVLDQAERDAIAASARADLRPVRDQIRILIRKQLVSEGLLPPMSPQPPPPKDG